MALACAAVTRQSQIVDMASAELAARMARGEAEALRGEHFDNELTEALKLDEATRWAHLLDVESASLPGLDTEG